MIDVPSDESLSIRAFTISNGTGEELWSYSLQ